MSEALNVNELPGFMFIDHVAFTVPQGDLDKMVEAYSKIGFQCIHREQVLGTNQVDEALLQIGDGTNKLQLVSPLNESSPVTKQLEKSGGRGAFAHIGYRVKSAQAAFDYLKEKGFKLTSAAPMPGSNGTTIFFVHPKSTEAAPFGVLIEVVEAGAAKH